MVLVMHLGFIVLSCGALWLGAGWLVDSAARLARRVGVSELVIGLTVVAFGTSAPELVVTVGAAFKGQAAVSVANIVGSNIFNIGFILGGCALVAAIVTRGAILWRDGTMLLAITILLLVLLGDGALSRWDGIILLVLLAGYLVFLLWKREQVLDEEIPTDPATWKDGPLLVLGLILIIGGGHFLVESSVFVARELGLSEWLIGLTIVAAGTSLPEFAVSLVALIKKRHGISAGNLIGSNIFNTLGVLGVAGALKPLSIGRDAIVSIWMLIGLTVIVIVFMWTGRKMTRWEGLMLVLIGGAIWGYNIHACLPSGR